MAIWNGPNTFGGKRKVFLSAFALSLALSAPSSHAGGPTQPISVGGSSEIDACPATAVVSGIRTFLAVREGPGVGYHQSDALDEGRHVYLCGSSDDGEWLAVIYATADEAMGECGVSTPIAEPRPYYAPCRVRVGA